MKRKGIIPVGMALGVSVLFFAGLGGYDLSAPDEPRYALVAREMIENGHWLLPHRNDRAYPDKPPLFFWCIAAWSLLNGGEVTALTARLTSAAAACGVLWVLFCWVRGEGGTRASLRGLLAVLVLLATVRFPFQARMAQIDMLLCLLTTLALVLGFGYLQGKPVKPWWIGTCLGLAVLAKGPVGYLVPVGGMLLFALLRKERRWERFPKTALLWGLLPVFLWLLALLVQVALNDRWAYLHDLLFRQTVTRYFNAWDHRQPVYYYLGVVLYDFFPWSPLLAVSLPITRKRFRALDDRQRFAWSVILFALVFFSLAKGKRNLYLLPIYPFAAYWIADQLDRALQEGRWLLGQRGALALSALVILAGAGGILAVALGWLPLEALERQAEPLPWFAVVFFASVVFIAGVILLLSLWFRNAASRNAASRTAVSISAMAGAMFGLHLLTYLVIMPWIGPARSAREFSANVTRIIGESGETAPRVAMVEFRAAYRFYGRYPLVELKTPEGRPDPRLPGLPELVAETPDAWVIVRKRHFERYPAGLQRRFHVHWQQQVGRGDTFMLIRQ